MDHSECGGGEEETILRVVVGWFLSHLQNTDNSECRGNFLLRRLRPPMSF